MELMDSMELITGLLWGAIVLLVWKQNKSKMWARIFGIGGGTFMLVLSMAQSIMRGPRSDIANYMISNVLLSIACGIVCYCGGRELARCFPD